MRRQGVDHEHRSLRFRVVTASGETVAFQPEVVARRGPILFVVTVLRGEPDTPGAFEILSRFLEQHSHEIVLLVIALRAHVGRVPPEAYDELYSEDEIPEVVRRIHDQDPEGFIRPFPKPRP